MVTFHPSAKRTHNGQYAPMVLVRGPNGHMAGSGVGTHTLFPSKEAARDYARVMAHRVAARPGFDFVRVR